MRQHGAFSILAVGLIILLAGCGAQASAGANPGTSAGTTVVIATDHTTYSPTEGLNVTVTNNTSSTIYAWDTRSGCSILDLQMQVDGNWQTAAAARCPLGRPAQVVAIEAGKAYTVTIRTELNGSTPLPKGTYRLVLTYAASTDTLMHGTPSVQDSAQLTVS